MRALIVILICGYLLACGQPSENGDAAKSSAPATSAKAPKANSEEAPPTEPVAPTSQKPAERPEPSRQSDPVTPTEVVVEKPSVLITEGKLKTELPEYLMPDRVRERLEKFQPELVIPKTPDFDVKEQHLTIDAVNKKVTFKGVLHVKGKAPEPFELQCKINTSEVPWVCQDMTPTDKKLAAQKRFQGTFKCLDTYVCDSVGVALWVVIDGKLQEPKLFQAQGFRIRRATLDESEDDVPPVVKQPEKSQDRVPLEPNSKPEKVKPNQPRPKISEKPKPPVVLKPVAPAPPIAPPETPQLTDEEIEALLDDPDSSVEISEPLNMPNPTVGKFSVPGIEKLHSQIGAGVRVQAVGWHAKGVLQRPAEFAAAGPGFISRDHGIKDYGTDLTVNLLSGALAQVNKKYPGRPPIVLGQVSKPAGGVILNLSGRAHASHQTGLDADVGLPSTQTMNQFFSALSGTGRDHFDIERFWFFIKQVSCAENQPVIAMFLDRELKKYVCQYVRQTAHENMGDACVVHTLQALRHAPGHDTHVHVRLRCPENSACQNSWVTLANGTGC